MYIQCGREAVDDCNLAIQETNTQFARWSHLTNSLYTALEEMAGMYQTAREYSAPTPAECQ